MKMARWSQFYVTASFVFGLCLFVSARNVHEEQKGAYDGLLAVSHSGLEQNFVCEACLQLSNEAELVLHNPDTEKTLEELFSHVACNSLMTPKMKAKCTSMVKTYVPDLLVALQTYLRPELCTEVKVCRPQLQFGKDTKTCALCQDFAADALTYLGSNRTKTQIIVALHLACSRLEELSKQCDLLVDVYAPDLMEHLNNLTPEEFCEMTRLCKPALATTQLKKRNDCAICQFVILELKFKLRDPKTQERLLEVLGNGCDKVINHVDECKMIVAQYAPFLLANLETILDADVLCTKIGACTPMKNIHDSESYLVMASAENIKRVHSL
ncbi:saposin [Marchantia polymorpha subsp. ruderalis]|uniref:Saposin B-type domain-containing protein n=4 Tax=Marchantia polymorpha TaxID=3197 RepID=A0AAF6AMJ0_MARPO|nr:hypothetical protein MARPO_0043s0129 [Marchantia polymorpha]PTQ39904.1 hypothetical protein MARPO_0043s0129 [Marchantia polymorpha]BBM97660.1 hypothetical protein Mp_1g07360 [Marchantia polymorpha subsp. ruderalis]BBM97661.1 hypothetical protein Mp_1g07360 [Marchantia polymorpha subsp. ruderalis]|eukprot:PTQ39903.1 hypothetical protein MARPO_0043s0129 [Marchantia polymorpha]